VEGAANDAVLILLAEALALPRRSVTLLSGERSRLKRVRIDGLSLAGARARLGLGG
jgi:uncharacterized protein YggU (UPF0235/DUF167 family)